MKRKIFWILLACALACMPLSASAQDATPGEAPSPDVTAETPSEPMDTPESTSEVTSEPTSESTPLPTPGPDSTPESTSAPEETQEPAFTPGPENTPVPAKAYLSHAGTFLSGEPNELVAWCIEQQYTNVTIYLTGSDVFEIRNATEEQLAQLTFTPDRTVFPDTEKVAILSPVSPTGEQREGTVYLWVGTRQQTPEETALPETPEETQKPADESGKEPGSQPAGQPGTGGGSGAGARGGAGGMSGAAVPTRTVPHASSTEENVVAYDGVELTIAEEEMSVLMLGGETLSLSLEAGDTAGCFSAQLLDWNSEKEGVSNTLLLCADETETMDGTCFTWTFTGQAIRKLQNSGIAYVVLQTGDQVTVISSAGCIAGTIYTLWRTQGIPSREFTYQVRMDGAQETALLVSVRGDTYALTADTQEDIYYYDVYTGTIQLLDALFGTQAALE